MLKQAGELSGDKVNNINGSGNGITNNSGVGVGGGGTMCTGNNIIVGINLPDIPIVTEPDYPERVPTMLGGSIFTRTHGTNERSKLAVAPLLDVSSSGADDGFLLFFSYDKCFFLFCACIYRVCEVCYLRPLFTLLFILHANQSEINKKKNSNKR